MVAAARQAATPRPRCPHLGGGYRPRLPSLPPTAPRGSDLSSVTGIGKLSPGSKRLKSASLNHAQSDRGRAEKPHEYSDPASIVVDRRDRRADLSRRRSRVESRRSRMKRRRKPRLGGQAFWNARGTQRRLPVVNAGKARTGKPHNERATETDGDARQSTARNCHAGGRGFESRRSRFRSACLGAAFDSTPRLASRDARPLERCWNFGSRRRALSMTCAGPATRDDLRAARPVGGASAALFGHRRSRRTRQRAKHMQR
jgi:hypothetical protein